MFNTLKKITEEREWCPGDNSVLSRLNKATSLSSYGTFTPEMQRTLFFLQNDTIVGAFFGITIYSKNSYMNFMENARASQFSSHMDAKDELRRRMNNRMLVGGIEWALRSFAVSATFGILQNFIPVIRNKIGWGEHLVTGVTSGTLAGYLFSNREALGFENKKHKGFLSYQRHCMARGFLGGLLLGFIIGSYCFLTDKHIESRKWEDYWKQRKANDEPNAVNNTSDSK